MSIELSVILQIILESLPVSSSGNLALLGLTLPEDINYATHAFTLIVYALFFRKKLFILLRHPLRCFTPLVRAVLYGICALVPTLLCYALFNYTQPAFPLWLGFLITSCVLLTFTLRARRSLGVVGSRFRRNHIEGLTCLKAFFIGCAQGIALLPGISRLGITYATARWLGLSWRTAFGFSCMIEAPLIFVASCKGLYDLAPVVSSISLLTLFGYLGATVISYGVLWGVYRLAQKECWWIFGIYTALCSIVAVLT